MQTVVDTDSAVCQHIVDDRKRYHCRNQKTHYRSINHISQFPDDIAKILSIKSQQSDSHIDHRQQCDHIKEIEVT